MLIEKGSKFTPRLFITPQNATEKIVWTSSDSSIASVDDKGVVTAIKVGQVTITGLGEKNLKGGSYIFNVINKRIPVTEIRFYDSNSKIFGVGFKDSLGYYILPDNATDKRIIWTSSNPEIAIVDEFGNFTGKKPGNVVIKARSLKDNVEASYNIRVEKIKIRFEFSSPLKITHVGEKHIHGLVFYPYLTTPLKETWSSSNEDVATVDNGEVTAKKIGKSRITVSYNESSSYYDVEVVPKTKK
ncbi:MAG: Ig-like domain-containing protein [Marinifilaceae bacterium]